MNSVFSERRGPKVWVLQGFIVFATVATLTACGSGESTSAASAEFPAENMSTQSKPMQTDPVVAQTRLLQPVTETQAIRSVHVPSSEESGAGLVDLLPQSGVKPKLVKLGNLSDEDFDMAARRFERSKGQSRSLTSGLLGRPVDAIRPVTLRGVARSLSTGMATGSPAGAANWQWTPQSDGSLAATLQIDAGNAAGMRVGFVLNKLPDEAQLEVAATGEVEGYRFSGKELNAILSANLKARTGAGNAREFWAPAINSARVEARVRLPVGAKSEDWDVSVLRISHLKSIASGDLAQRTAASCNSDATCLDPQPWIQDAVAVVEFVEDGGTVWCTGTLLADTAATKLPYFLTAEHCINSQEVASTVSTYWFYRSSTCDLATLNPSLTKLIGGARLLYSSPWIPESDTSFLLLNSQPPLGVAYAGWNSASAGSSSTFGLHHPQSDRLQTSSGIATSYSSDPTYLSTIWSSGITENGSSGSGLFNTSNQLIGQLSGGYSSCSAPNSPDFYGRFDYAYNKRVQDWLNVKRQELIEIKTRELGDFNGDGRADLLWRSSGGLVNIAFMNGAAASSWKKLDQFSSNVKTMGAGDFNGDGIDDIVWRNMTTGAVAISLLNANGNVSSWLSVGQSPIALNVALEGIGDFDGNGRADMLWRNTSTGRSVMSYHNTDGSVSSWPVVSNYIDPVRTAAQRVGDINGDGKDDIVWRNITSGNVVISLMDGNVPTWVSITASPIPLGTVIEAVADFDGNGRADILWRNTSTGRSVMSYHNNDGSISSWPVVSNYIATYVSALGAGDFDGDGKADIVWRNLITGNTVISLMNGATPTWVTLPL